MQLYGTRHVAKEPSEKGEGSQDVPVSRMQEEGAVQSLSNGRASKEVALGMRLPRAGNSQRELSCGFAVPRGARDALAHSHRLDVASLRPF